MNARGFARTGTDLLCGILAGAAAVGARFLSP